MVLVFSGLSIYLTYINFEVNAMVRDYEVGIITKMSKNYGAVLQAYALKRSIEKLGHSTSVINYNGAVGNDTYLLYKKGFGYFTFKYNIHRLLHRRDLKNSIKKFQDFRLKNFNLTTPYVNYTSLKKTPPKASIYVVGSDQVWNPKILFSPIYYLRFGNDGATRISYAASFGEKNIHPDYKNVIKKYLEKFDAISVREDSGAALVHELGLNAKVVLDPTLLLGKDEWAKIAKAPLNIPEHFILCYFLHYPPQIDYILKQIKEVYKVTVVNIATDVGIKKIGDVQRWDIGPEEFIWLFQNADAVVTSSFHGTVFSIIFDRPFYTLSLNKHDGRLFSLLNTLRLDNHLIHDPEKFDYNIFHTTYAGSDEIIERLRGLSLSYLEHNIIEK